MYNVLHIYCLQKKRKMMTMMPTDGDDNGGKMPPTVDAMIDAFDEACPLNVPRMVVVYDNGDRYMFEVTKLPSRVSSSS